MTIETEDRGRVKSTYRTRTLNRVYEQFKDSNLPNKHEIALRSDFR